MRILIAVTMIALAVPLALAEDTKSPAGLEWLKQFEGTWATDFDGTMESRIVGERWIVNEFSFQNGVFAIQILGYDEKAGKFVGSWVDATSSHIWSYVGSLDDSGKVLVLDTEGPDLQDPSTMRKYQDTYEFKSPNEIAAISKLFNDEKKWQVFNDGKMTRK